MSETSSKSVVSLGPCSLRLNEQDPGIVELLDEKGTVQDIFSVSKLTKTYQKLHIAKSWDVSVDLVSQNFAQLYLMYKERVAKQKGEKEITLADIDWEGVTAGKILHGAGGFNNDFIYETTYVPTRGQRDLDSYCLQRRKT